MIKDITEAEEMLVKYIELRGMAQQVLVDKIGPIASMIEVNDSDVYFRDGKAYLMVPDIQPVTFEEDSNPDTVLKNLRDALVGPNELPEDTTFKEVSCTLEEIFDFGEVKRAEVPDLEFEEEEEYRMVYGENGFEVKKVSEMDKEIENS